MYIYLEDYLPTINQMLGNEVENSTTKTDYVGAVLSFVSNNIDNIKIEANTSFQLDFTSGGKVMKNEFKIR